MSHTINPNIGNKLTIDGVSYYDFLRAKAVLAQDRGSSATLNLNPILKPHQADIAAWAIRGGNRAGFTSFGTGKTFIEIQILQSILEAEPGEGLIVCPLGVRGEFLRTGREYFGIEFHYCPTDEALAEHRAAGHRFLIVNYERIRDGQLDPNQFTVVSLDEASVLRSFGSKTYQTFLTLFDKVKYKYVFTATPAPNRHKELIHYAGFLGIMDTGQALTRFFKRDSTQAGNLQLHPHKEREFWLWVSTWATFLDKPSDLGYDDTGYDLPELRIHTHRLPVDHSTAGHDSWGQGKLLRNAATGVSDQARERRDSLEVRVQRTKEIIDAAPADQHWLIWHDLEDERRAIEKAIPEATSVWGREDLEEREQRIADFSDGKFRILSTKPSLAGSGCNFQKHCYSAIYVGVGYKFNDFIQSIHRLYRYLQTRPVDIHIIYTESEDAIFDTLMAKWKQHDALVQQMTDIVRECGLSDNSKQGEAMRRAIWTARGEDRGKYYTAVNNDNVVEAAGELKDASVDLIVTSWPFSDHYEYTETYNDFGHNEGDEKFFAQMNYLSPQLMRALKPGRMYCIHAKDRILYGSVTGDGMYTVNPFSDKCVAHMLAQGFRYCGRITIVTDVVRENSQTYRLGWTEKCKDATKMGVGSPEYILIFRKLPSDRSRSYADLPVVKDKSEYTRSRWQFDASPFWRSSGNRFLTPDEIRGIQTNQLRKLWQDFNRKHIYNFEEHVKIAEQLEEKGLLPASFMLLDPQSHSPWVWDDVTRMRTLNTQQSSKRQEMHVCPLQLDVVERLIETYSDKGDLVLDPFAGLMTVPYVAIKKGRTGYGIELNTGYWADGIAYCRAAEREYDTPTLFDLMAVEDEGLAVA